MDLEVCERVRERGGSGVATGGKGGPLDREKFDKNREKEGENKENVIKGGKNFEKGEKSERFFHFFPPDRWGWLRYCVG